MLKAKREALKEIRTIIGDDIDGSHMKWTDLERKLAELPAQALVALAYRIHFACVRARDEARE